MRILRRERVHYGPIDASRCSWHGGVMLAWGHPWGPVGGPISPRSVPWERARWLAFSTSSIMHPWALSSDAASAFGLVMLLDAKRNRRKARKRIPALLRRQLTLARNRLGTAEQARDDRTRNTATTEPPFSRDTLTRLTEEVPDYLTDRQQQGLDNIALLMREADLANSTTVALANQIFEARESSATGQTSARAALPAGKLSAGRTC